MIRAAAVLGPRLALSRGVGTAALLLACLGVAAVGVLGLLVPADHGSLYGTHHSGASDMARAWGAVFSALPKADFVHCLRWALTVAWAAYGVALLLALRRSGPPSRGHWVVAVGMALVTGLCFPPWLSSDPYAYVAYGRMWVLYDLNPYTTAPSALRAHADPVLNSLYWDVPSVYGPVWSAASALIVALLRHGSVFEQVMAMKVLAAVAYIALAWGAARLARQTAPHLEAAAFTFIAFSPLYLIEGPGSGHNDVLMLALAIWGVVWWEQGHLRRAALMLGLAGAVKFVAFLIGFWLLGRRWFAVPSSRRLTLVLMLIAAAPFLLGQAWFLSESASWFAALHSYFAQSAAKPVRPDTSHLALVALVLGLSSAAVLAGRGVHWTVAWLTVTALAILLIGPPWPWYWMWPGLFLFTGQRHVPGAAAGLLGLSYLAALGHAYPLK